MLIYKLLFWKVIENLLALKMQFSQFRLNFFGSALNYRTMINIIIYCMYIGHNMLTSWIV